jgi:WD repeat-containing protein 92
VAGTLEMLKATTISTQPINCFDWNNDRQGLAVCGALDQTVRVIVTTKLNLH